jgi:hypothetical protein
MSCFRRPLPRLFRREGAVQWAVHFAGLAKLIRIDQESIHTTFSNRPGLGAPVSGTAA